MPFFTKRTDAVAPPEIDKTYPGARVAPFPEAPPPRHECRWKTHTVIDGDSLASLAKKYLGDEQKAVTLLGVNRDVLNSPDILPIGAKLRIPSSPLVDH